MKQCHRNEPQAFQKDSEKKERRGGGNKICMWCGFVWITGRLSEPYMGPPDNVPFNTFTNFLMMYDPNHYCHRIVNDMRHNWQPANNNIGKKTRIDPNGHRNSQNHFHQNGRFCPSMRSENGQDLSYRMIRYAKQAHITTDLNFDFSFD